MLARRRFRRGARPAVPGRAVQIPVATAIDDGFVDELTLEPAGLARVFGWWRGALDDLQARLALILDGAAIPATPPTDSCAPTSKRATPRSEPASPSRYS